MPQAFRVFIDVIYREESPPVDANELGRYIDEELSLAGAPGIIKGHRIGVATLEPVDAAQVDAMCDAALSRKAKAN